MGIAPDFCQAQTPASSQPQPPPQNRAARPTTPLRAARLAAMQKVEVASPDGNVKFILLPNAERLNYTVKMEDATIIEISALKIMVDVTDMADEPITSQSPQNHGATRAFRRVLNTQTTCPELLPESSHHPACHSF